MSSADEAAGVSWELHAGHQVTEQTEGQHGGDRREDEWTVAFLLLGFPIRQTVPVQKASLVGSRGSGYQPAGGRGRGVLTVLTPSTLRSVSAGLEP